MLTESPVTPSCTIGVGVLEDFMTYIRITKSGLISVTRPREF